MNNFLLSDRVLSSQPSATVRIADKAKKMREQGKTVYDFSAGRSFEHTPQYVIDEAIRALESNDTHQTMAHGTTKYREACAAKLARENNILANPESEIIATMGCKQGLTVSLLALLNPGDEVIVEDPCFVSYQQSVNYFGGKCMEVPLFEKNGFRWKREQLEAVVSPKTKAIIMCTPHNPTGVVHTQDDLEEVAAVARKHNLIVITDEPYERTVWGNRKHINMANLPGMRERTITLMSLTKSFSMGGWRAGFAFASAPIIEQMTKLQQHLITCVNSFVQAGAIVAFGEPPRDEVLELWSEWEKKVEYFTRGLNQIDRLNCPTPEGGFYGWVDISALGMTSVEFCDQLLEEEQVALIPGSFFGKSAERYVRVTCVKSWDEINHGLEGIKNFMNRISHK